MLCDWAWSYEPDDIPDAANMIDELAATPLADAARQVPRLAAPGARASAANARVQPCQSLRPRPKRAVRIRWGPACFKVSPRGVS